MKVNGKPHRTIWLDPNDPTTIRAIDQRVLPHRFEIADIKTVSQMVDAIKEMLVRGAPLIGVAAAYGMYLAALEAVNASDFAASMNRSAELLLNSRPTAVNLAWAVAEQQKILLKCSSENAAAALLANAITIADNDVAASKRIGDYGLGLIRAIAARKPAGQTINILTHCNAGWLCAVDWGTATAPIYRAFDEGMNVHVWVDETRPRNQGASLTAWELGEHGVPYTLITDNAGGHLMQNGHVDLVIVGTDRTTRGGDVANKIGTYLKALAAKANDVPFYVAAPISSIDWDLLDGKDIPIEERGAEEVKYVQGLCEGELKSVLIAPKSARAANFGFDVTPRHLVTALITERGVVEANEEGLAKVRRNEGVVKFECSHVQGGFDEHPDVRELIRLRNLLFDFKLIGVYPDGIGYGNISVRMPQGFVISGSQTGHIPETNISHFSLVTTYSIKDNFISSVGQTRASSESLTHAMVYDVFPEADAVVHVHNAEHWNRLKGVVPTTDESVPYGTPEMAAEIDRLARTSDLRTVRVLVMAGHEDGILSFGATLADAVAVMCEKLGLEHVSLIS
jgi:methylthioribose-1-phosphate isomerase